MIKSNEFDGVSAIVVVKYLHNSDFMKNRVVLYKIFNAAYS